MSWQDEALCPDHPEIDWFPQPGSGGSSRVRDNLIAARAVCADCPVKAQCMADALAHWGTAGIWAGTTQHEREHQPRERRQRASVVRCGTLSGYKRHLTAGEPPCDPCRAAQREYQRSYRARLA